MIDSPHFRLDGAYFAMSIREAGQQKTPVFRLVVIEFGAQGTPRNLVNSCRESLDGAHRLYTIVM